MMAHSHRLIVSTAAFVMLCLFTMLAPSVLRAQIPDCPCSKIPLTVQSDVTCRVTFIIHRNSVIGETVVVSPGSTVNIECEPGLTIDVVECGSNRLRVPVGGCLININTDTTPVCCVDVCLARNADGCWALVVRPTISAAITCPCR